MPLRLKFRRYGAQMSIVIIITIAITTLIWQSKDITRDFKYLLSVRTRNEDLKHKRTKEEALDDNKETEGRLKIFDLHSFDNIGKAGDEKGIDKDQKQIPIIQMECLVTDDIVTILKQLISELIDMRVTLDGRYKEVIEEKYDKFQKILNTIERNMGKSSKKGKIGTKKIKTGHALCSEKGAVENASKKFDKTDCTRFSLSENVTVVIDNPYSSNKTQKKLADTIRLNHKGIKIFEVNMKGGREKGITRPYHINQLIAGISTPFVYISRQLESWTTQIDLERLVDVMLSKTDIVAIGTAVVNTSNGHWSHGCMQSRLQRYVLKYERGYYQSDRSCIRCDALEGPFLVRTDFLRRNKFYVAHDYGYYEDWFLRVQGHTWQYPSEKYENARGQYMRTKNVRRPLGVIYSCPDVTSPVAMTEFNSSKMVKMADLWDIKKIVHNDGRVYWFGCKRALPLQQGEKCRVGRGMAVPPCCLDNLKTAVIFVMGKCREYGVACELTEGTLLGAVKFQTVLPWERDADIAFYARHFNRLLKIATDVKKKGYNFTVRAKPWCCVGGKPSGGTVLIIANGWNIEMYGSHSLDSYKKTKKGRGPTRIRFAGEMVNVPDNPGYLMRKRYGKEIYKHAEHWMNSRMNSGWDEYNPRFFNKCEAPGHHACLDHYKADGSSQFKEN